MIVDLNNKTFVYFFILKNEELVGLPAFDNDVLISIYNFFEKEYDMAYKADINHYKWNFITGVNSKTEVDN